MLEVFVSAIRQEEEIKIMQTEKEEVTSHLFTDNLRVYTEILMDFVKEKLLELINEFSRAVRYKINIQRSILFLYSNNK